MNCRYSLPLLAFCSGCLLQAASSHSIAVFVDFENEPSLPSFSQMKTEVAEILKPSGLSLDWRLLKDRSDGESFLDLVVLRFRGTCQVRNPAMDSELGPSIERAALATTNVSDGRVLPFSDVKCDEIRRYLAPVFSSTHTHNVDEMYGRALGRVVAHELYHIFAGTETHAASGVARPSHSREDLTSRHFRFTSRETETLRDVKWRALLAKEGEAVSWQRSQQ